MQYSLGNIVFFWQNQSITDFYERAASSSADHVYIGESVCSKRRLLILEDWLEIARELQKAGKEVVLSSMALLEAKSEISTLKKACDNGILTVEANDFGTVQQLYERGFPFVAGAALNVYNQVDLKVLVDRGMQRWVMPVELSRDWLTKIKSGCEELNIWHKFETEVYGYGYLPLAYSARCFTARSEDKPKDQCEFVCLDFPQGRKVKSQEGGELFTLNGIQTLSGKCQNLINDIEGMQGLVDIVRISPHSIECLNWLERFRERREKSNYISLEKSFCNGYWHRIEGMELTRNE